MNMESVEKLKESITNEDMCQNTCKHSFDKETIILDTYIYLHLLKYFKKIELYRNGDQLKDMYMNEFITTVESLNNQIKREHEKKNTTAKTEKLNGIRKESMNINDNNNFELNLIKKHLEKLNIRVYFLIQTSEDVPFQTLLLDTSIKITVPDFLCKLDVHEIHAAPKHLGSDISKILGDNWTDIIKNGSNIELCFNENTAEDIKYMIFNNVVSTLETHSFHTSCYKTSRDTICKDLLCRENLLSFSEEVTLILNKVDDLLFTFFEPGFINCYQEKLNRISYKSLYDKFSSIMIRSEVVKLNKEFISYILCRHIYVPNYVKQNRYKQLDEDAYSSFSSYSEEETKVKEPSTLVKENEREDSSVYTWTSYTDISEKEGDSSLLGSKKRKKDIQVLFQNNNFKEILKKIEKKLQKFKGGAFLRVNWKNLKKGSTVINNQSDVHTLYDALLMLKFDTDIYKVLKRRKKKNNYLIISKYVEMDPCYMFEVFVYNNNIIAVSQKYLNFYFEFLKNPDNIIEFIEIIKTFFERNLKHSFPVSSYICHLYIHTFKKTSRKKVILMNARQWLYKNKHPFFTREFLKHYILTQVSVKAIHITKPLDEDRNFISEGDTTTNHISSSQKEKENQNDEEDLSNLFIYDNILYYCLTTNNSLYKRNNNVYPKDIHYVKSGEIDISSLMETMKRENNIQ